MPSIRRWPKSRATLPSACSARASRALSPSFAPRPRSSSRIDARTTGETAMHTDKIKVRITDPGKTMDVVVLNKRVEFIVVVLGEGIHNVKCQLTPTRNGMAYAGSAMGREIVYERSREQVKAELELLNPTVRKGRPR